MCSGSGPLGAGIRSPVPHPSSVHGPSPLRLPGDHSDTKAITTRGWSRAQAVTGDRGVARTHLRAPERSSSWHVPWMPKRASRRPVLTVGSRRDGLSQNVRSSGPGTSVAALDAGVGRGGRPRLHGGGSRVLAFLPSAPPPRWGPSREGRGCPDGRGAPRALPTAEQCLPERQMLPSLRPCRPGRLPPNTARQDVGSINSAAVAQWGQRGLESQARPAVGCHRSHRSTEVAARWMGVGHLRPQPLSGATPLGTTPPGRTLPTPAPAAHPDSPPSFRCPRQAGQEPEGLVKATLAGGHSIRAEGALLRFSGPGPGCSVPRDPHGPGSTPRGLHGPGCTPRPPGPYRGAQSPPLSRPPSTPSIEPSLSSGTPRHPQGLCTAAPAA